jgi:hypothetical protein
LLLNAMVVDMLLLLMMLEVVGNYPDNSTCKQR